MSEVMFCGTRLSAAFAHGPHSWFRGPGDHVQCPGQIRSKPAETDLERAVEAAIGLNVDCGGAEGVYRVRDAVMAAIERELPHVGWYCWRCEGFNLQACRSDCVPIYVPKEWEKDMRGVMDE